MKPWNLAWSSQAEADLQNIHWDTAGRIDAALMRLAETGEGTLRKVVLHDQVWSALLLWPYAALVTRDKAVRTILVWRVVRYA